MILTRTLITTFAFILTGFIVQISGFLINFNPTDKLIELSSIPNLNLLKLIKISLRHVQLWPILIAFRQARFYNFMPVFAGALTQMRCSEVLEIIENENFPVRDLFNVDVLNYEGLGGCFSRLPIEFFQNRLQINPTECENFQMSYWGIEKSFQFFKLAFDNPKLTTNWYSWANDEQAFNAPYDTEDPTGLQFFPSYTWPWIWKLVSSCTINTVPDHINLQLIDIISHGYEESANRFYRNDPSVQSRLSVMLNWSNIAFFEEEILFSHDQIMKIITISLISIIYALGNDVNIRARDFLNNSLAVFRSGKRKFPLRTELKKFIRNVLATSQDREPVNIIQDQLLSFAVHLKGIASCPFFLNLILLWSYFNQYHYSTILEFVDPFTKIFFSSATKATAPDTCLLLKLSNSFLSGTEDDEYITKWIIKTHFVKRSALAKEVFKECPNVIPKFSRVVSKIFPLSFRLEDLFMKSRFVFRLIPVSLGISFKEPSERICLSVFKKTDYRLDFSVPIPMNLRIMSGRSVYDGNLPGMLNLFFHNLMFCSSWFRVDLNDRRRDSRPILLPNLTFPPHFMESLGVLLAQAVVSNVRIPFLLDERYFNIPDAFDSLHERRQQPISALIEEIYPEILAGEYSFDIQLYRIIATLDFTTKNVIEILQRSFLMRGNFDLEPISVEPNDILNTVYNLNRIVMMGADRLRSGLNVVIPGDSFKSKDLYKIIFK